MSKATFKGGAHPYECKSLSENAEISLLDLPGEYVFPMSQHIGAPAKPCVNVGDNVLAGQKIGEAQGFISADVISSVSGTGVSISTDISAGLLRLRNLFSSHSKEKKRCNNGTVFLLIKTASIKNVPTSNNTVPGTPTFWRSTSEQ